jgi:hypothetical protein
MPSMHKVNNALLQTCADPFTDLLGALLPAGHRQLAILHQLVGHVLAHLPPQEASDRLSRVCTKSAKYAFGTLGAHFVLPIPSPRTGLDEGFIPPPPPVTLANRTNHRAAVVGPGEAWTSLKGRRRAGDNNGSRNRRGNEG